MEGSAITQEVSGQNFVNILTKFFLKKGMLKMQIYKHIYINIKILPAKLEVKLEVKLEGKKWRIKGWKWMENQ